MSVLTKIKSSSRAGLQAGLALAVMFCAAGVAGKDFEPSEYQLKAAFLVNFPKYVDWPPSAFASSNSPVVITVLGENRFGEDLNAMVNGKTANGRPIVVRYVAREAEVGSPCHILFVTASEEKRLPAVLEKFKGTSTLTVGENDAFLDEGGMINLARDSKKIQMEVNLAPTRNAGLKISSRLLSVAGVVKGREN